MVAVSLIVPMYNETERFSEAWPQLAAWIAAKPAGSELIFVDDGSGDGTPDLVAGALASRPEVPARLLREPHTGKGAAVRAGLLAARAPIAAFCDVDLSASLADLDRLIAIAAASDVLAIGSRGIAGARVVRRQHPVRESLGKLFNQVVQRALVPGIHDTQCGAKAASTAVWRTLLEHSREVAFAWDCEVVAIACRLGLPVRELAITWRHDERSRMRVARDGPAMLLAMPRIMRRVRAIRARPR